MTAEAGSLDKIRTAKEKAPKGSWRYFRKLIRYSSWLYLAIIVMRGIIFGIFPQLIDVDFFCSPLLDYFFTIAEPELCHEIAFGRRRRRAVAPARYRASAQR